MEILQINSETTAEIVRRHLTRIKSEAVAFSIPEGWTELDNVAQMRLLQRQARQQGVRLALITREPATRKAAQQAGVPVYGHPEQAIRGNQVNPVWSQIQSFWARIQPIKTFKQKKLLADVSPQREKNVLRQQTAPKNYQNRQARIQREGRHTQNIRRRRTPFTRQLMGQLVGPGLMGGVLLAIVATFALYILPAATITLSPGREILEVSLSLTANPNIDIPDFEENQLPARIVEKTMTESGSIATTGRQQKAAGKATGFVTFSNIGRQTVRIPAGTIVSTATGTQVSFRTTQPAALEGGVGTRITAPIEALEEGTQGNVRANTINTVQGSARLRVRVSNPGGTSGGGSTLVSVVTQNDKERLLAETIARVDEMAVNYLQDEVVTGEWMPPDSVQTTVMSQLFDQFNDDEAGELQLNLRSLIQGTAVNDDDVTFAMSSALNDAVPEGAKLVTDSVRFFRHPGAQIAGRTVQFTMTVQGQYVPAIDPIEVKEAIAGLTPMEAEILLQRRWKLTTPPTIYRDPTWLTTLPELINRIQVRIKYENR